MNVRLAIPILCAVLLSGCDDTFVDPFDNDGEIYSVFGFISLYRTEHHVRVVPVTRYPERIQNPTDTQAEIDARVHTVDLTTGQQLPWAHSLRQMDDGSYGHVYSASFEPRPGRSYRLVVTRSDGRTATAETRIPYGDGDSRLQFDPTLALEYIANGEPVPTISATLRNAIFPTDVTIEYMVYSIRTSPFRVRKVHPIEIDYGRQSKRSREGEIQFRIDLERDAGIILRRIRELQAQDLLGDSEMEVQHMTISMQVQDENWFPEGGWSNLEELSLPGTLSNVENGFGFFGAIGHLEQQFELGSRFGGLYGFRDE